jgi:hypothetical protein
MKKGWYTVAISAVIVGCGGDTDNGSPARGSTGGATSINTGHPQTTGGFAAIAYGVMIPSGGTNQDGGAPSAGGTTGIDTGNPQVTGGRLPIVYGILPNTQPRPPTP